MGLDQEACAAASHTLKRLCHEMHQLERAWAAVLPPPTGLHALGAVVSAPLEELVSQLLEMRHISDADSSTLGSLLAPLIELAEAVLTTPAAETAAAAAAAAATAGAAEAVGAAVPTADELMARAAPPLCTARQAVWVLGVRLSQVRDRREAGELGALEPAGLASLLRALFDHAAIAADATARSFLQALDAEAAAAGAAAV